MVFAENNFVKRFHVSFIRQRNQKDKIALTHLQKCKIVFGNQIFVLVNCRAHPDIYKPLDVLDDDEVDDASMESMEPATETGDEKLNQKHSDLNEKKSRQPKQEKSHESEEKPKQRGERKIENHVARSG
jgi:hypothetical protein